MIQRYNSTQRSFFSEMNFAPFIDIIFVMMIIFMITAPFTEEGIEVSLPKEETKEVNLKGAPIITITKDKRIFLDNKRITPEDLEKSLKKLLLNDPKVEIFLKADKKVPYGNVVMVMASIKRAGIERLGMITENPEK